MMHWMDPQYKFTACYFNMNIDNALQSVLLSLQKKHHPGQVCNAIEKACIPNLTYFTIFSGYYYLFFCGWESSQEGLIDSVRPPYVPDYRRSCYQIFMVLVVVDRCKQIFSTREIFAAVLSILATMTKSALQQNLTACLHYCTATIGIRRMVVYVWDEIQDDLKVVVDPSTCNTQI